MTTSPSFFQIQGIISPPLVRFPHSLLLVFMCSFSTYVRSRKLLLHHRSGLGLGAQSWKMAEPQPAGAFIVHHYNWTSLSWENWSHELPWMLKPEDSQLHCGRWYGVFDKLYSALTQGRCWVCRGSLRDNDLGEACLLLEQVPFPFKYFLSKVGWLFGYGVFGYGRPTEDWAIRTTGH